MLYAFDVYLPGQTVNGEDVSFQTHDTVWQSVRSSLPTLITIKNGDEILFEDNAITYTRPTELDVTFLDWIQRKPINVEPKAIVSETVRDAIDQMYFPSCNAEIILMSDNTYVLVEEIEGLDFDKDAVKSMIVIDGIYEVDIAPFLIKPTIYSKQLRPDFEKVSWLNEFSITYSDGTALLGTDLVQFVDNYELTVTDDYIKGFVTTLASNYNTVGLPRVFTKTGDTEPTEIAVGKWGTLGRSVREDEEFEFIQASITNRESAFNREPAMLGYDDLSDTYVEISIEDQHLWYYKDGELYSETDVVTGLQGRHDTPRGLYYMSECLRDKILRGEGYASFVNYWMRLTNSGIGLHDATWRSRFGDTIYTYDGSHGCINLPHAFAKELFKESYVGMPVVIY